MSSDNLKTSQYQYVHIFLSPKTSSWFRAQNHVRAKLRAWFNYIVRVCYCWWNECKRMFILFLIDSQHSRTKNNNSSNVNTDLFSLKSMTGFSSMPERKGTAIYHFKQHVWLFNILLSWWNLFSHWIEKCREENPNMWTFSNKTFITSEGEDVLALGIPWPIRSWLSLGRLM